MMHYSSTEFLFLSSWDPLRLELRIGEVSCFMQTGGTNVRQVALKPRINWGILWAPLLHSAVIYKTRLVQQSGCQSEMWDTRKKNIPYSVMEMFAKFRWKFLQQEW